MSSLDASKVKITKTTAPKTKLPNEELRFGMSFTDHMLTIEWTAANGWDVPEIKPYQNLSLDPSASVFHYSFELFEGMKAYRDSKDMVRLFRPDKNMTRMNGSAERICLPTFDGEELIKLIGELISLDKAFIPQGDGYSLYIRPTLIGTTSSLNVATPDKALLYVICSPVPPYSVGFKAVKLEATDYATRAWPGGVGNKKLGGNYAPCIRPQLEASKRGYNQNLWLFGEEGYVTEVGMMNAFFVFKDPKTGKKELVTAPLDGTILEGVTRDSILALARERLTKDEWDINERYYTIHEVKERAEAGTLVEAFGAGTAAVVTPIKEIGWKGEAIDVPLIETEQAGELTKQVLKWILDIQYGRENHPWSVVVN